MVIYISGTRNCVHQLVCAQIPAPYSFRKRSVVVYEFLGCIPNLKVRPNWDKRLQDVQLNVKDRGWRLVNKKMETIKNK